MFSRLRLRRPSHTTVVAYLSLFLVLTGSTAFASHLIVRSSDIVDNEVRSRDVRNDNLSGGGLASADVRADALRGSDIGDGQVTDRELASPGPVLRPTFGTGWSNPGSTNVEPVGFRRERGRVFLQGFADSDKGCNPEESDPRTIFILPPGYRPAKDQSFVTTQHEFGGGVSYDEHRVDVLADGQVVCHSIFNNGGPVVSLSGITFIAGQ